MKTIFLSVMLLSSTAFGTSDFSYWKWGLGFSQLNGTLGGVHLEIGSPAFNKEASYLSSLVLSYDAIGTEIESSDEDNYVMNSAKLFWELRNHPYKEILSYYFRVGAGYNWMNKYVNSDGGFAVAGFQLGTDFIVQENPKGVTTFYAQVGQDFFLNSDKGELSRNLDGTIVILGVRRVY